MALRGASIALAAMSLGSGALLVVGGSAAEAAATITSVGSLADNQGNGVGSLSVSPKTVGDALVLAVKISSASATVSSVSGGGASWTKVSSYEDTSSHDLELWLGTVTATGSSTISVGYSASVSSTSIELTAQEFTAGLGSASVWSKDVAAGQSNASSTTIASPTLTAAHAGELYVSYSRCPNQVLDGSTPGFTYDPTSLGNMYLFDPSVTGTVSPTSTQSPANTSAAIGALLAVSSSAPAPTVTGVSPSSGPAAGGTAVTVTGTNFASGDTVSFGGVAAGGVTVASASSLSATSPAGSGTVDVTVTGTGGTSTKSTADQFTYAGTPPAPTVTGVSPSSGPAAGGTAVTVTGTNFASGDTVSFGGVAAGGVTVASASSLSATSPAGSGTVDVTVTGTGGTSTKSTADQFTYTVAPPVPTVTALSPTSGPTGGISRESGNFPQSSESYGNDAITISPVKVGDLVVLSMQLHTTSVSITSISGGNVAGWQRALSYSNTGTDVLHYEVWWGVAAATGPSTVSISYSAPVTGYAIELIADSFASGSGLPWSVVAAAGASGPVSTSANWPSLTSGSSADQLYWGASEEETSGTGGSTPGFTYDVTANQNCFLFDAALVPSTPYAPSCNESPASVSTEVGVIFAAAGAVATPVTITGTNFATGDTVSFGGVAATGVTVVSASKITATAPRSMTAGTVDVTVTGPGGTSTKSTADQFTYVYDPSSAPAPTVTGVSPSSGPAAGGTAVTVTGTNFASGDTVSFGGVAAGGVTVASASSLSATSPAGSGTVDVTVTGTGGTSTKSTADQFTYAGTPPAPTVTGVSPSSGPAAGGTAVTVTGTNFASGDTVSFGGVAAGGVTVASASSLSATSPAGSGTVDVTVTGTGGTSTKSTADQFTYTVSAPVITSVGSLADNQGNGVGSLSVSPKTVGDALVLAVKISSASATVSSVSGGGASWTKVSSYEDTSSHDLELWLGTVTATGSSTISVGYSASVSSTSIELTAQEFTAGLGSASVWSKDVAAGQSNASSTTIASPTLTAAHAGELYVSYSRCPNQVLDGSTPGFTYDPTSLGNMYLFDPSVTGTVSPTSTQSPANTSAAIGALLAVS